MKNVLEIQRMVGRNCCIITLRLIGLTDLEFVIFKY